MNTRTLLIFAIIIVSSLNIHAESTDSIKTDKVCCNDTIEIVLKNGYSMYWKVDEMDIITPWEESKFSTANKDKKITRISMYRQMADTTSLNIYVPYKTSGPLRVGDLVIILLMHQLDLPITDTFDHDMHWFNSDSPIPDDILDWIENNREKSVNKMIRHCKNPDKYYTN